MVAFGHTAIGVAIGIVTYNRFGNDPYLAVVLSGFLGVVSHYLSDLLPHGHFFKLSAFKKKIAMVIVYDLLLGLVIFISAAYFLNNLSTKFFCILFAIGGSQLPDVIDGLIYTGFFPKKGFLKIENDFHQLVHWHGRYDNGMLISKSDLWQMVVVIVSLAYLFLS